MDHAASGPQKFTIFINDVQFHVEKSSLTGAEIKALGSINAANRLFLEGHGSHQDTPIADNEVVELKSGMKFYDLPPGVVGREAVC